MSHNSCLCGAKIHILRPGIELDQAARRLAKTSIRIVLLWGHGDLNAGHRTPSPEQVSSFELCLTDVDFLTFL
jgi:hypothetical protein